MIRFSAARIALTCALAITAFTAAAGSAQATVTASTISSPAANSYFYYDHNAASTTLFTVTGTTTGTGNVDIDCYDGVGDVYNVVTSVAVTSNAFTVPVTTSEIDSAGLGGVTCALRAVPAGDGTDYAPGSTTSFPGPSIAVTEKDAYTTSGATYNFDYYLSDFSGYIDLESAGSCGLDYGELIAAGTLTVSSSASFDCMGAFFGTYKDESGATIGPEVVVDGAAALVPDNVNSSTDRSLPGYEGLTVSESFNGGALTIQDDEPLMLCTPSCTSPTSYASAGVELDRTWQVSADGLAVLQTDSFTSTDGRQHTISVLEDDEIARPSNTITTSIDFPGSSGFQDYGDTATVTLPTGAGTIYFKDDHSTPDTGDGMNPQGSVVYTSAPNGPVEFTYSDEASSDTPEWVMPYTRTIPAGGSAVLRFAYTQAYALSSVQSLAASALAAFKPVVTISAPANGATVSTGSVTVSGTAHDAAAISSVTVNGHAATLGAGGAFSASVPLTQGANTITATATDSDGLQGQAQITVTYKNPPAVTTGAASKVKATSAKIAGTVNPEGQATTYAVQYGKTAAYGSTSAAGSAGSGSSAVSVSSTLTGLKATTTYHYRVIATSAGGTSYGSDRTFRTGKPTPTGLGAKVSGTAPHFTVKGKLGLPHGISKKKGCAGTITIKVKHGKKTVATKHVKISKKCTWKGSVTASGKLKITPSFGGNSVLARLTGKPLIVG